MPTPIANETQIAYLSRCMGDPELVAKYADSDQRSAICHAFWRNYQRSGSIRGARAELAALRGAEILATGMWPSSPPIFLDTDDLDGLVASFDALGLMGRIPLKFGHEGDDARDGAPALGWVERIWRDGERLLADFKDIPRSVYDLIQQGSYKFVSVELLRNVQANTRIIPWVLDAVALLGATPPAVGILKDLQALTMARGSGLRADACVAFRRDHVQSHGGDNAMTNEEQLRKENEELRAKFTASDAARIKAQADAEAAQKSADKVADDARKDRVTAHRAAITKRFAEAIGAGRIDPKVREQFASLTRYESNDADCERVTLAQVDDQIELVGKPAKQGKPNTARTMGGSGGPGHNDEPDYSTLNPAEELRERTVSFCRETNQDPNKYEVYLRASQQVLRANPDLADKYKYMPTERFRATGR